VFASRSRNRRVELAGCFVLRTMMDEEVHVASGPDIRLTDESFWKQARVVMPKPKETVTMRLDADLLA
jgi:hypothetical protein